MPRYIKSVGNDAHELVLVEYPDSPQFEVRFYSANAPYDHRTLIATDNVADAERIYQQRAADL